MVYKWSGWKFTADRYAVYKWLGRKYSPSPQGEGLFRNEDRQMKKTGFYIIKDKFLKICQIRISKEIRQETDHIITALKIQVPGYIGWYHCLAALTNTDGLWRKKKKREILRHSSYRQTGRQPGERISDTRYVSDNRRIHRTGIYNRRKSSDVDEWAYRQRDWAKARKVMGMLKRGIKFTPTQPDVMAILEKLRERR